MNNYDYNDNINYILHNENDIIENENDYNLECRCAICFDNIKDIEDHMLNKLCVCMDSLVCNECLIYLENNDIKNCPVCRGDLNFNIIKQYVFNIRIVLSYYINFILFILCNVIIYNISIYFKYYNDNSTYPLISNTNYNNLFIINDEHNLDTRYSNSNYYICKNSIIYKNSIYFIITNLFINILFPLTMGINNSICLYKYTNDRFSSKVNIMLMYILTFLNMTNISILCIVKKSIDHLYILLVLNIIIYSILFIVSISIYLFTYLKLFHNYMINTNMNESIKYTIITRIVLNNIQSTNV
jgi:hypothetical protein